MLIAARYILREHIAPFIFGTSVVMFLFLMQFVLRYIDQLVGKGLSTWVIIQLVALNLSWMLVLAVPMGVLFSTLMTFGSMSAAHEVTVLKASGAGLIRMMIPSIIAGAFITLAMFWFNDAILPDANHRAKILLWDIEKKKPTFNIEAGQFSTQLDGYTILSRALDSTSSTLLGVTIYDRTQQGRMTVVTADTGTIKFSSDYNNVVVQLSAGEIHQLFAAKTSEYRKTKFSSHRIIIPANGFKLERSGEGMFSRGDREMRIKDMQQIVDDANRQNDVASRNIDSTLAHHVSYLFEGQTAKSIEAGQAASVGDKIAGRLSLVRSQIEPMAFQYTDSDKQARQYLVEIYKKYAIPFACFVFVFVGCPLGILTRGGNFGISAAISLGFYVLYWACLIGGEKLADRQLSSPLAMWLANVVIGGLGIVLTLRTNNESLSFSALILGLFRRKRKPSAVIPSNAKP